MKKLLLLIIALAIGIGLYAWYAKAKGTSVAATQPTVTAKAMRGDIYQSVSATGRVVSNLDVDIKCQASGEIIELPYDVSQKVKKGALLVQLDPVDEDRAVHQAQVAIDSSKAKLEQAKQNLIIAQQNLVSAKLRLETARLRADANLAAMQSRAKDARSKANRRLELLHQKLTSQEDYDTAETTAEQAEADVKTAQAEVEDIKAQAQDIVAQEQGINVKTQDVALAQAAVEADQIALDDANQRLIYTKVLSPMDGVVSALDVQKGVIVASGTGGFSGGTTLMTLSDMSHIFVLASVDESDIGQVQLDNPCKITADAFPGKHFKGTVVRIATKGVNTSNVVTFEVKIEITGDNKSLLKPEMTTNCEIISAQRNDAILVPTQAIVRKDRKNTFVQVVQADGKTEDRPVQIGISDGENYEITDGLHEGETVVLHNAETNSRWAGGGGSHSHGVMGMGSHGGGGR